MLDLTEGFDLNPLSPAPHGYPPLGCAAVLGAGAWGTALASALQRGGVPTWLWARRPEVAEALEIPVGTVKSRLFRARRILQGRLRRYA
ncbi:MAG: hypothetical protein CVU23_09410, partial [Betaproteobacteria bacterium HGW-Betaproteobacteria-17]